MKIVVYLVYKYNYYFIFKYLIMYYIINNEN